jgi:hypothetical protein
MDASHNRGAPPAADQTWPMPESRTQAVLAADVADGGTGGQGDPAAVRRIAREVAAVKGGRIFDGSGEGIFALYENVVDAVGAALAVQAKLREQVQPGFSQLRIGVHVGQVLFQDGRPFGETLIIGSLLESLAEPGGVLVSAEVKDAVALQLAATFEACGLQAFTQIQRRIATFRVRAAESFPAPAASPDPMLDETLLDQPPDVAQRPPSPLPQDDNAGKAVSETAPSAVDALDATMNITMLDQPPELKSAAPNDQRGGAGTGRLPEPTLDETLLGQPPNVVQRSPSPLPQDDNAGKAVSEAARSAVDALDATMSITMLGQPPELNSAAPNDQWGGAGARRPQAAAPPDSVVVLTGAPAPAPRAANGETIPTLPEGGAPASSDPLAPDAWRRALTQVLVTRIGPIAPIIVNREAAAVATLAELIERLAETIPSLRERAEFRIEAARLLPRSKS